MDFKARVRAAENYSPPENSSKHKRSFFLGIILLAWQCWGSGSVSNCQCSGSGSVPYVFGPPGSVSGSVSHKYGSCSVPFIHQAKIVRKTLILYCFVTSLWPFIFKEWCKCTSVPNPYQKCHGFPTLLPGYRSGSTYLNHYRDLKKRRTHHWPRICRSGRGRGGSPSSPTVAAGCPHALHKSKGLQNIRNSTIKKEKRHVKNYFTNSQLFALFYLFKTTCSTYSKWQNIIYCIRHLDYECNLRHMLGKTTNLKSKCWY